jgi:hypothetical protein
MKSLQLHLPHAHTLLLPQHTSMMRSLSAPSSFFADVGASREGALSLASSSSSSSAKLPPRLKIIVSQSDSSASDLLPPSSSPPSPQPHAAAFPHAFDVDNDESLPFRFHNQMSASLTRSQPSPFKPDDGSVAPALLDSSSSAAEVVAALEDCPALFDWTRGEMIGRGGFGVVCVARLIRIRQFVA